jgi:hypothetical protein
METTQPTADAGKWFRINAAVGAFTWAGGGALLRPELAVVLLLFGPLVCIPLGLALLADRLPHRDVGLRAWQALALAQPLAAFCLLAAFALPPGEAAALWTLPWLAFTGLVALTGLVRLREGVGAVEGWGLSAGMLFLVVGGGWTTLTRLGAQPMDFAPVTVLLTAVHFHYAGFVLPLLTGLAGQALPGRAARLASVGVIAGVPAVAVGISLGRSLPLAEVLGACFLVAAGFLVAWLHLRLALGKGHPVRRALLALAGVSLVASLSLAAVYALGQYLKPYWLSVPTMIPWHGILNAFGFALPGLLAWQGRGPITDKGES